MEFNTCLRSSVCQVKNKRLIQYKALRSKRISPAVNRRKKCFDFGLLCHNRLCLAFPPVLLFRFFFLFSFLKTNKLLHTYKSIVSCNFIWLFKRHNLWLTKRPHKCQGRSRDSTVMQISHATKILFVLFRFF